MSAAEQHRAEAIQRLASVIRDIPGRDIIARAVATEIVDSLIAAAVETFRDLAAAESTLNAPATEAPETGGGDGG